MKEKILGLALLLMTCSTASADINGARPRYGCTFERTNTDAACDLRYATCLGQIVIPIFYDPEFYEDIIFCYNEDRFCRESGIEVCEPDPNVPPPPPEEPPPGWDSPPAVEPIQVAP